MVNAKVPSICYESCPSVKSEEDLPTIKVWPSGGRIYFIVGSHVFTIMGF